MGSHVALRRQGQHFIGLCPFHGERSPSFHVRADRGFFKCFGCGVGGDAIRFVERIENLSFLEAARTLAKRVGIELEPETPLASKARELRDAIYAANTVAAAYFHQELVSGNSAAAVRAYAEARGIDAVSIERFQLGFAPDGWNGLRDALRAAGIADEIGIQAGLLKEGSRGPYDFYRNRLMIPTMAVTGEIVAFGGRALGNDEPKYLNTATTPVYTKGKMLFGLAQARRAVGAAGSFIVVEGYLDCIALHRAGFEHAVASLGTAFTAEQAALMQRFTSNIYLAFDADKAGQSAMLKSLEVLDEAQCKVRVVDLPAGADPDSLVRERGPAGFQALLDASRQAAEVRIDDRISSLRDGFHEPSEIAVAAERLVRSCPRAEWDRWRVYIAERLGLSISDLRRALGPTTFVDGYVNQNPAARAPRPVLVPPSREREILGIFLEEPTLVREYRSRISAERIKDARLRRLYELLCEGPGVDSGVDVLALAYEDELASQALLFLTTEERSSIVRFAGSDERRQALDHMVLAVEREDDERLRRELAAEVDGFLARGESVPSELLERHRAIERRLVKIVKSAK